jgi:hypothetical protein
VGVKVEKKSTRSECECECNVECWIVSMERNQRSKGSIRSDVNVNVTDFEWTMRIKYWLGWVLKRKERI